MPYIPSARVITILYPEGTATIGTVLCCLTMSASSFVNAVRQLSQLDSQLRCVAFPVKVLAARPTVIVHFRKRKI